MKVAMRHFQVLSLMSSRLAGVVLSLIVFLGAMLAQPAQAQTASTTTIASSPNPSSYGQSVAITARVTASSGTTAPTGAITLTDTSTTTTLGTTALTAVTQTTVATGYYHSCSIGSDGAVSCWGNNGNGQLGDGTTIERRTPAAVSGLSGVAAIAAGAYHTCALKTDGTVSCWGYNGNGQLGDNTTIQRKAPVAVSGLSGVAGIAGGDVHTCALKTDGTVSCWGRNILSELGDGTTIDKLTPVAVSGLSGVAAIGGGGSHTCALKTDGTVSCWGFNGNGRLGDGTTIQKLNPVAVLGLSGVAAIDGGGSHTCALKTDGTVSCWGYNGSGQLGDGTVAQRQAPVAVSGLSGVAAISGGFYHTCALKTDGAVSCWGYNGTGQLGDGTTTQRQAPAAVSGLAGVAAIAGGLDHTCSLKTDGTVLCWGNNGNGQLGDGTTIQRTTPVITQHPRTAVAILSTSSLSGGAHTIEAAYAGDVNTGASSGTTSQVVNAAATTTTLASNINPSASGQSVTFTATVSSVTGTPTGNVELFNGAASLGTAVLNESGVATLSTSGLLVAGHSVTAIYAGTTEYTTSTSSVVTQVVNQGATTTTLSSDNSPSLSGQSVTLTATVTAVSPATGMPSGDVEFFDGASSLGMATLNGSGVASLSTSGLPVGSRVLSAVYSGSASFTGSTSSMLTQVVDLIPTTTVLTSTPSGIAKLGESVALSATVTSGSGVPSGSVTFFDGASSLGATSLNGSGVATLSVSSLSLGAHTLTAAYGASGNYEGSTSTGLSLAVNPSDSTTTVSSSPNPSTFAQSVTVTARVEAVTGGVAPTGTVTITDTTTATPMGTPALTTITQTKVAAGGYHTCSVGSDGGASCWGDNGYGQLGNGTTAGSSTPVPVSGLSDVVAVAGGSLHSCALTTAGTVKCWGHNGYGQLGNGTTAGSSTPVQVSGLTDVVAVAGGYNHSCALTTAGTVKCWGNNNQGQLGNDTTASSSTPVPVSGLSDAVAVVVGAYHSCAVTTAGAVKCWGYNDFGQLGDGTTTSSSTPLQVSNLADVVAVAGGQLHSCALTTAGAAKCWGNNFFFQLGDGTTASSSLTPIPVSGPSDAVAIGGGDLHSCALTTAGAVKCWGWNGYGQLGDGTTASPLTPVTVSGVSNVVAVAVGVYHSCALTTAGAVKCWGYNGSGQLGDGTTADSSTPVRTLHPTASSASLSTSPLAGGAHTIQASYAGDGNFNTSSGSTSQTVNPAATTTVLVSSTSPSVSSQNVTFTATVSSGAGIPGGSVEFFDGSTSLGLATLNSSGVATLSTSDLAVGAHSVTAVYAGTTDFATSTSSAVPQVVNQGSTTTTLVADINPAPAGQAVTLTANVAVVSPASGIPGGNVEFFDGALSLGTATLNGSGEASLSTSDLAVGTHSFTAVYAGDASFAASTSSVLSQTVERIPTTTVLTSSPSGTAKLGQSVVLSATVNSGSGTPGGPVTFFDGSNSLGTTALNGSGVATLSVSFLSLGSRSLTAAYAADGNHDASTSAGLSLAITPSDSTTTVSASSNPSSYGQSVDIVARVQALTGTTAPSGAVSLTDTTTSTPLGTPALTPVTQTKVATGGDHTCSIGSDGSVSCWGLNNSGQLGDGSTTRRLKPVAVTGLSGAVAIVAGSSHTCALTAAGGVKCWGSNGSRQLGDGTTTNRNIPVAVSGLASGVTSIAVGNLHSCALMATGGVKCWGYNGQGQLGDVAVGSSPVPVDVSNLSGVVAIAAGGMHSCALKSTATVECWGNNGNGELGDGTTTNRNTPASVSNLGGVSSIVAGPSHSCALTTAGQVKCWGFNGYGGLGNNTSADSSIPVDVSNLSGVAALSSGGAFACAVTTAGAVYCWGYNYQGQIGDGSTTTRTTPVSVVGLTSGGVAISSNGLQSCVSTTAGSIKCWGNNSFGQLGDGSTTNRSTPVSTLQPAASLATLTTSSLPAGAYTIEASFAGDVNVSASSGTTSQTVNPAANVITFPALANTAFASPAPIPAATASSNLTVTYSTTTGPVCTATGSGVITFVKTGTCTITASQAGNANFAGATAVARSFTVTPGSNVITFPALANTAFTSPAPIPAATASSKLAVTYSTTTGPVCTVTGAGVITFVKAGTCTITARQAGNANFAAAAVFSRSFNVTPGTNTITFPAVVNTAFTSAPPVLAATASSNLAVTYASTTPLVCTATGAGAITFVKTGACTITASQAGNANFAAAAVVSRSFNVTPGTNTITFPALVNTAFTSAPPVLAAMASSNLAVTYASTTPLVCTATGAGAITFVKTGACTITASQAGNANFAAATAVARSFTVTPGVNTITFPALANTAFTSAPPIPAATASSSLAVTYASTTPLVCTATGARVITFVKTGTCTISASQAGNANFAAATAVIRSFNVTPGVNTITFPALANTAFSATPPVPAATASSKLAVTYASTTAPVCTITSVGVITFVKAGTCTITASQSGNANFAGATAVARSFTVTPGSNVITFPALANTAFTATPPVPAATASSKLAVTYASTTAPVCTATGAGIITFVKTGTCTISASQAGNANFATATAVTRSFNVTPGTSTITFPALANTAFSATPPVPAATASSKLAVTYASTTAPVCTVTGAGVITFVKTGTCTISASQAGNANFAAATVVIRSFNVTPGVNTITFPALANTAFTATPPVPAATSSSKLAVTYASTTAPVCTVTGAGVITFVKTGTCTISASQAGNANFAAATVVIGSFSVTPGVNTITFPALANTAFTATPPVPAATSSSKLAVTYASTTAPVCTVTSVGVITFVKAGTCTITASQAGNASFAAATVVTQSFTVTPGVNTITFPALAKTAFTATPPVPAATSSSKLAVTYASTTAPVCTVTAAGVITFVKAGTCTITASQAGNASFAAATPVSRSFTVLATVTVVTSTSKTPSAYGVPVTFTAKVTVPTGGAATGTVTFKDGGKTIGVVTLANGAATLATAGLEVGAHSITAAYDGNAIQGPGVSAPLAQVVTKANPVLTLTVTPNPVEAGQPVALAATLSVTPTPATGQSGSIVFRDGATVIGSTTILAGKAAFSISTLAPGGHSLTASYVGDTRFAASTSASKPLTVQRSCKDAFASATAFTEATGSASGSTNAATGESGEGRHGGDTGAINSVWCKWTAPAAGRVTIDTTGSTFDTTLAVYTGASLGQLTKVAANDNIDATTRQSRVSFTAVQGRAYLIAIDGAGAARGAYVLSWTQTPASPQLLASVHPSSRSVLVGSSATASAILRNTGSALATQCRIILPPGFPAAFSFQTATSSNALTGTANTAVDIKAGAVQNFVVSITPTAFMEAAEIPLVFDCANTQPAASVAGLNRFILSASATPSPDIIAIATTLSNDGIVSVPLSGAALFTVASLNIGAAGTLTVRADDGGNGLPLAMTLCRNNPATSACAAGSTPATSLTIAYAANATMTFTVFVKATGAVAFDPALNRILLRWKSADGITRGVTSVAVRKK